MDRSPPTTFQRLTLYEPPKTELFGDALQSSVPQPTVDDDDDDDDDRASQYTSRSVCKTCKAHHHTSICDKKSDAASSAKFMSAGEKTSCVTYPVVVVEVNVYPAARY